MTVARIGILALALIAAGLAAFLARNMVSAPGEQPAQEIVEAPTEDVLVAAADISLGSRVAASDLKWQAWPEDAVSSAFTTRAGRPDAMEKFTGSIARSPLLAGEPVTGSKLVNFDDAGFMSALIEPGKRAISVRISPETGAGGFILPNDRVDVIVTERSRGSEEGGGSGFRTTTILRNVRVLAVDQQFKEVEGEQVVVGKTATLELTPGQAESLTLGTAQGEIALSLRSLADAGADKKIIGAASERTASSEVRVVRYGSAKTARTKVGAQ